MSIQDKKMVYTGVELLSEETYREKQLLASIRETLAPYKTALVPVAVEELEPIREAYVAQSKPFRQVSELVSEKTKTAHIELYHGYIESMNRVSAELDTADKNAASPTHSAFKSLKQDETFNTNGVWLHELYFANCFDPKSEITMDTKTYMKLQRDFGTFDDWQRDFIACALAAGEGWAVCGYHVYLKRYINTIINDHASNVMIGLVPVLVVDLWNHAYMKDYLNDKQSYVIAMLREINWQVVEERVEKTESVAQVYK